MIIPKYWSPTKKLMVLGSIAGGKAVEDTATGNPVTFQTDLAKPLKSLVANFLPIQASGTPSPDNILPITGWTGVNVNHAGKNLLNAIQSNAINYGSYDHYTLDNGVMIVDGGVLMGFKVQCKPSAKYTFSINPSKLAYELHLRVYAFENEPTTYDTSKNRLNVRNSTSGSFTTQSTDNWLLVGVYVDSTLGSTGLTISDFMLEVGENATAYEPYTAPDVYPVTFPSTIYGGYVDLVTGEAWATHIIYNSTWATFGISRQTQNGIASKYYDSEYQIKCVNVDPRPNIKMCNVAKWSWKDYDLSDPHYYSNKTANDYRTYLYMPEETDGSLEIQLLMELINPVLVTTLTPQQITALIGNNTVWSDANGDCSVTFLKKG